MAEKARLWIFLGVCWITRALALGSVARGSVFQSWYADVLATFGNTAGGSPMQLPVDERFAVASGKLGSKVEIEFLSEAFASPKIRYARMVSFCGKGYDVFNFLAVPEASIDLPMFGADVVVLPGGVLAAVDLQPLSTKTLHLQSSAYQSNSEMFGKWQKEFPPGGAMPSAAQRYFSPHALWTRFGPMSDATSDAQFVKLKQALSEYCQAYCRALNEAGAPSGSEKDDDSEQFLDEYLTYRTENDPAKNMLVGAFGASWTESCLKQVMFPRVAGTRG